MLIQKAYRYRLRTTPEIESRLLRMAGCRRFVWNDGLAKIKSALDSGEKRPGYHMLCTSLLETKRNHPFLVEDAVAQSLQQTLKDLDRAVKDYFDRKQPAKGFPIFKKKGKCTESFRIPQRFRIDESNSRIKLPKIGWLRYRNSRSIVGEPKSLTVSLCSGYWYISIQTEHEVEEAPHKSAAHVGIDRGVNCLLALSDGTLVKPLQLLGKTMNHIRDLQRQLSKKVRFSKNWNKCKGRIAKLCNKVAAMRRDFLHKTSTFIAKNHGLVVLEDLKICHMVKSVTGVGRKRKSGLNRAILDQGWGEIAWQLEYKLRWLGGVCIKVPPQYTSQRCYCCGHVSSGNRKGQKFCCLACGHADHADINAAKNILAAGLAAIACGDNLAVRGTL